MSKFIVYCEWEMCGNFEVEADSLDEAINKVRNEEEPFDGLPSDGEYIVDSFNIRREFCEKVEE